eukprot:14342232-Alexandrium_andersonii.AAC.1
MRLFNVEACSDGAVPREGPPRESPAVRPSLPRKLYASSKFTSVLYQARGSRPGTTSLKSGASLIWFQWPEQRAKSSAGVKSCMPMVRT